MEYVDDGYSGRNFDRPEIKRLLKDASKNRIQCIMVKDFSRFGRDYVELGNYIEKVFPFMGIRFIAVNNHFDSITLKAGEVPDMDFSFQNLIYDYYSVENSIKTKKVQEKRRQVGKYMSVFAPYGYQKDPQDKNHLIIDEEAAKQVRDIFEWYLQGKTKAAIARILDAREVPTPAEYMKAKGSHYNWRYKESQGKWCGAIIGRILRNRIYTGTLVSGKTEAIEIGGKRVRYKSEDEWCITRNTHQPIIPMEFFEEVQYNKAASNYKVNKSNKDNGSILKGYLRCGGCKHKLTKRSRIKVSFYCRYYYELHKVSCIRGNVYEEEIKEIVLDAIRKQVILAGNINYLSDVRRHLEQAEECRWRESRHKIEEDMEKLKKDNFHLYELYRAGEIEKEIYLTAKDNNEKQLRQLEERYAEYNDRADDLSIMQQAQRYLDVLERNFIETLIETIEIYPENRLVIHMKYKSVWSLTPDKRD